jgi:hypothetical protein
MHSGCRRGKNGLTHPFRFHSNSTHWPSMWRSFPFFLADFEASPFQSLFNWQLAAEAQSMTSRTPCRQQPADTEVAVYAKTTSRPRAAQDFPQTPNMPHDPTGPSTSSVPQTDPPTFLRNVGGSVVGGATSVTAESRHCPTDRDSFPNVPSDPLEKVDGSVRWHFSNHSPRTGLTHRSHFHLKLTHRPSQGGPPLSLLWHFRGRWVGASWFSFEDAAPKRWGRLKHNNTSVPKRWQPLRNKGL